MSTADKIVGNPEHMHAFDRYVDFVKILVMFGNLQLFINLRRDNFFRK